jgi:hypothetical protein
MDIPPEENDEPPPPPANDDDDPPENEPPEKELPLPLANDEPEANDPDPPPPENDDDPTLLLPLPKLLLLRLFAADEYELPPETHPASLGITSSQSLFPTPPPPCLLDETSSPSTCILLPLESRPINPSINISRATYPSTGASTIIPPFVGCSTIVNDVLLLLHGDVFDGKTKASTTVVVVASAATTVAVAVDSNRNDDLVGCCCLAVIISTVCQ